MEDKKRKSRIYLDNKKSDTSYINKIKDEKPEKKSKFL